MFGNAPDQGKPVLRCAAQPGARPDDVRHPEARYRMIEAGENIARVFIPDVCAFQPFWKVEPTIWIPPDPALI